MDPIADRVMEDIKSLGLGEYAEELDEKGYTVLPPDIACPDGLKDRLLDACLLYTYPSPPDLSPSPMPAAA